MKKDTAWTEDEIEYLSDHFPHSPVKDITRELKALFGNARTPYAITAYTHRQLGLRKYRCKANVQTQRIITSGAVTVHRIM